MPSEVSICTAVAYAIVTRYAFDSRKRLWYFPKWCPFWPAYNICHRHTVSDCVMKVPARWKRTRNVSVLAMKVPAQWKHIRHASVPAMYPHTTLREIHLAPVVIDYQAVSSQDGCRWAQFGATWTWNVPWRGLEWRFGCQVNFTKTRCVSIKPGPSKPNQIKPGKAR